MKGWKSLLELCCHFKIEGNSIAHQKNDQPGKFKVMSFPLKRQLCLLKEHKLAER